MQICFYAPFKPHLPSRIACFYMRAAYALTKTQKYIIIYDIFTSKTEMTITQKNPIHWLIGVCWRCVTCYYYYIYDIYNVNMLRSDSVIKHQSYITLWNFYIYLIIIETLIHGKLYEACM